MKTNIIYKYLQICYNKIMVTKRWRHSRTSVYNIAYHIIWCLKYRKPALVGNIRTRLIELLYQKAEELDVDIEALEVMPDHLHMFIRCKPIDSPHFIVRQFKGYSARILRAEFPELLKLPSLWTRSYFCVSVGSVSEEAIKRYIESQWRK